MYDRDIIEENVVYQRQRSNLHRRQRITARALGSLRSTVTVILHDSHLWYHFGASSATRHALGGPRREGAPISTAITNEAQVVEMHEDSKSNHRRFYFRAR